MNNCGESSTTIEGVLVGIVNGGSSSELLLEFLQHVLVSNLKVFPELLKLVRQGVNKIAEEVFHFRQHFCRVDKRRKNKKIFCVFRSDFDSIKVGKTKVLLQEIVREIDANSV